MTARRGPGSDQSHARGRKERQHQGTRSGKQHRPRSALEETDSSSPVRPPDQGSLPLHRQASTSALHLPVEAAPPHHPAGEPGAALGDSAGIAPSANSSTASQALQMELAILTERIRGCTVSRVAQTAPGAVDVTFWNPLEKEPTDPGLVANRVSALSPVRQTGCHSCWSRGPWSRALALNALASGANLDILICKMGSLETLPV